MKKSRFKIVALVLISLLILTVILYLSWGSYKISPADIVKTLLGKGEKLQRAAVSLGLNLNNERKKLLTYGVVLAGMATAFAGNVGFIGLICPHMAKRLVGPYHKNFLAISAMISIVVILLADSISRNLFSPIEIPVGITVSIFGVPYFI